MNDNQIAKLLQDKALICQWFYIQNALALFE